MSITIDLAPDAMGRIRAYAEAAGIGIEDAAARFLNVAFSGEPVDPADMEALREGIADEEAGRTVSLEEWSAGMEARYPWLRKGGKEGDKPSALTECSPAKK